MNPSFMMIMAMVMMRFCISRSCLWAVALVVWAQINIYVRHYLDVTELQHPSRLWRHTTPTHRGSHHVTDRCYSSSSSSSAHQWCLLHTEYRCIIQSQSIQRRKTAVHTIKARLKAFTKPLRSLIRIRTGSDFSTALFLSKYGCVWSAHFIP